LRVYGVKMSYNNGAEEFIFPLNPSEIAVSESSQNATYDVVGLGEVNVIKDRKLPEYSFSGLFPAQRYPFLSIFDGIDEVKKADIVVKQPAEYIELIGKWMSAKKPIRFVFESDTYDINTAASIESFEWREVAGSSGDIEYSITLKKYVFYAARKIEQTITSKGTVATKDSTPARPNEKQQAKTYKLAAGDSLWKVAQKQLGNSARWKEIQKLNNISDAELTRLQVGKVLKLP
jgi:LysM repeat protein